MRWLWSCLSSTVHCLIQNGNKIGAGPLWVKFPSLPLYFWSEDIFICIGHALGTYPDYDKTYIHSANWSLARILVYLDTREGLEEEINL